MLLTEGYLLWPNKLRISISPGLPSSMEALLLYLFRHPYHAHDFIPTLDLPYVNFYVLSLLTGIFPS